MLKKIEKKSLKWKKNMVAIEKQHNISHLFVSPQTT